jgi:hypothetical protein
MKTIVSIWIFSILMLINTAEGLKFQFWLYFTAFILTSLYIIKHSKSKVL